MSASEKNQINAKLAEVAASFGLKIKLTITNAQNVIENNYRKIKEIDNKIANRLSSMQIAA